MYIKVKLLPKCNLGFFCECVWVKSLCESVIMTKEALLRLTIFSHFQWECMGHFYASIEITILKTVWSLNTTWNFTCSITRVSTHEHEHWEHCMVFEQLMLAVASSSSCHHGSPDVLGDRHVWIECMWFSWAMCRDPGDTASKGSCCVETS